MSQIITRTKEEERIAALYSYNILDTVEESDFDDVTALASAICQTSVSLVTMVDTSRQWFKSHKGMSQTETPIEQSFCASAIISPDRMMIVEDAKRDDRFRNNVLVTGEPYIAFYAGVPLVNQDGYALGTLCVIDSQPKQLTDVQVQALKTLARTVMYKLELKKKIVELQESEERFRYMAESSSILIAVGDETSNAVYFNKAWVFLTGRPMEELLAFGWADLVHPKDRERYVNIYLESFKIRTAYISEFRVLNKEGNYCWLLANATPRFRPDGSFAGYISSCIDITHQKELEDRKDDFISIASHELKSPVTNLKTCIYLIDSLKEEPDTEMFLTLIAQLSRGINRISSLTDHLLNAARINQGQVVLKKTVFDVIALLHSCCQNTGNQNEQELICVEDTAITIEADQLRIEQVILNFLSNAIKYAPRSKAIYLTAEKEDSCIKISVRDEGPGISAEKLSHLFERYYRNVYSGNNYSGLGLGLYICSEIIKLHDGRIGVDSIVGQGSTFWFTLPL